MTTIPPTSSLIFRLAIEEDAAPLARLINTAFRNEKTGQTWLYDEQDKRKDLVTADVTRKFIVSDDMVMLVGQILGGTEPVATCFLQRPSTPAKSHRTEGAAWLGLLAVQPHLHKRGYGLALLSYAEQFVQLQWSVKRLELDYVNARTQLGEWYERCGYKKTGASQEFNYGENGREILADGLEMLVVGKDLSR